MAHTRDDGWVWAFVAVTHFTAEAWATVAKRGARFAATEPICDASGHFQGALRLRTQTYTGLDARGLRECHAGDGSMIS